MILESINDFLDIANKEFREAAGHIKYMNIDINWSKHITTVSEDLKKVFEVADLDKFCAHIYADYLPDAELRLMTFDESLKCSYVIDGPRDTRAVKQEETRSNITIQTIKKWIAAGNMINILHSSQPHRIHTYAKLSCASHYTNQSGCYMRVTKFYGVNPSDVPVKALIPHLYQANLPMLIDKTKKRIREVLHCPERNAHFPKGLIMLILCYIF